MQDDQPASPPSPLVVQDSQPTAVPSHPASTLGGPDAPLSRRQEALIDALERLGAKSPQAKARSRRAIEMYREAVRASQRSDSVESFPVAAYELREFMNQLPRIVDVPRIAHADLVAKARTLLKKWKNRDQSACHNKDRWVGDIDRPLQGLLDHLKNFFEWFDNYVPTRRQQAAKTINKLYPSPQPLPFVVMNERTKTWSDLLQYFNSVAHHNLNADPAAFTQRLTGLEIFLLDQLQPRTSEAFDAIDQLIAEAEDDKK